jgi:formamidopyrimidine-DNA glycosylase
MIELPEAVTIARQMSEILLGVPITHIEIAESRPRFLFLNEDLAEYEKRLPGRQITTVRACGKWILARLDSGMILLLGEMFGRILWVPPDATLPKKRHVVLTFEGEGRLVVTIQAWGGVQVLDDDELASHPWLSLDAVSPLDEEFTSDRFNEVLDHREAWSRKPIKAFLVHEGNVRGIGNGYLQDILFRARLHPRRKVPTLDREDRERLRAGIVTTVREAIAGNGRDTEKDLHGAPGSYVPLLDRRATGTPCPQCDTPIEKISYLGGSCYLCPRCQPSP